MITLKSIQGVINCSTYIFTHAHEKEKKNRIQLSKKTKERMSITIIIFSKHAAYDTTYLLDDTISNWRIKSR